MDHLMLPGTRCGVKLRQEGKADVEGYWKDLPRVSPPPLALTTPALPVEKGQIQEDMTSNQPKDFQMKSTDDANAQFYRRVENDQS
jgi:hypothetical protein